MYTHALEPLTWCQSNHAFELYLSTFDQIPRAVLEKQAFITLSLVWEVNSLEISFLYLSQFIQHLRQSFTKPIVLIYHTQYKYLGHDLDALVDYSLDLEFDLMRTVRLSHGICSPWNSSSEQMLFLTGKIYKMNRLSLFWQLVDDNQLPNLVYSLFDCPDHYDECFQLLPDKTPQEVRDFIKKYQCSPDLVTLKSLQNSLHYGGFPYNRELFAHTFASLIAETNYRNFESVQLTEKTWKCIWNVHPFIMAASPGTLDLLKTMGFDTFESFLTIHDYDHIYDDHARLSTIVANCKTFMSQLHLQIDKVRQSVAQNHARMQELYTIDLTKLQAFAQNLAIDMDSILDFEDKSHPMVPQSPTLSRYWDQIRRDDKLKNWKNFYQQVKDPSWPDCSNIDDFFTLPKNIQQECIDCHGLDLSSLVN